MDYEVKSIEGALEYLCSIEFPIKYTDPFGCWFRGQPDKKYELIPSIFRQGEKYGGVGYGEMPMVMEFMRIYPEMSVKYNVPEDYYFRIHHIRPRFKNDVESVLIYVATEISKLSPMDKDEFMERVNQAIKRYPGNATKTKKTINNWRTEISSLFGLIEYDSVNNSCFPSAMAVNLADNQDLVEFFKYFLYYFQYPGAHLKSYEILKLIQEGIKLLSLLTWAIDPG